MLARLCLRHSDGECMPLQPRNCDVLSICEEAAMKLRKEVIVEDNALCNRVLSVW